MQYRRPAFTLIELLVVIAIIGILSALVITQLGNSSIKARNATAQSDIAEMGKAVESFRVDDTSLNQVVSNVPGSTDALTGTSGSLPGVFTGTQSVNGSSSTYAASVSKTPSTAYTYRYVASGTPAAATASTRQLVGPGAGQPLYALCTNLVNAVQPYFCAADGSGAGPSGADQVLAAQGLGNLSAAATNGLAAWYKLDESGTAAVASDSSGTGNNGSLTNFTFDGTTNGWVPGKIGGALQLNGSNDYVYFSNSYTLPVINATYSAYVMPQTLNVNQTIISGGGAYNTRFIYLNSSNHFQFYPDGNGTGSTGSSATTAVAGRWYNVTVVIRSDGTKTLYVNGNAEATGPNYNPTPNLNRFAIGAYINGSGTPGYSYFNGSVDDVRIYNRALSANEVQQLYQGTL